MLRLVAVMACVLVGMDCLVKDDDSLGLPQSVWLIFALSWFFNAAVIAFWGTEA